MSQKKQRNAAKTKEALQKAATKKFTQKGFETAGLREIAKIADVDVALINRYFGSKKGLFRASIIPYLSLDELLNEDIEHLPKVLAEFMRLKGESLDHFDPMQAILMCMGSETVGPDIKQAFDEVIIAGLAEKMSGDNASQRAAMIIALLFGFDAINRILQVDAMNESKQFLLRNMLEDTLEMLFSDPTQRSTTVDINHHSRSQYRQGKSLAI